MTLKPEEIRLWEMVYCAWLPRAWNTKRSAEMADYAIQQRRERIQRDIHDPGAREMR